MMCTYLAFVKNYYCMIRRYGLNGINFHRTHLRLNAIHNFI